MPVLPQPENERERLDAVRALALVGTAPEPHFDAVCRTAQALFGVPICLVSLVEEHDQWFKAQCGLDLPGTSRAVSFCAHAILADTVLVVADATQDPRFADNPLVTGAPGIRFYAGAPLILRPGIRVGTLCLIDTKPRSLSTDDTHRLEDLARVVVAHLRLHEALRTGEALTRERAADIAARRRAEAAAAESEARYREVLDSTHDAILGQLAEGVIVTDAAGRITLVNEAAAAIHGVARLDVEPDDYSETYHLYTEEGVPYPPEDLPLARAVTGATVRDARWRVRRPDGVEVLAIGSARPLIGRDGHRVGAILTMRDDTARDAAERALRAGEAELRELNATLSARVEARTRDAEAAKREAERASLAKTEFLASMSHEIRTPLNAILGFTDLMIASDRLPPDLLRQAELVRTSGAALLTIVNDILDFSKVEAGAVALDRQAFDPRTLVDSSLCIVRGSAEQKGLAVRAVIDPALPRSLYGDAARLRQVLLNLLNNAIKFTTRGAVTLSLRHAGTTETGERLSFNVADTGIGIARAKQGRLFQRFSQVDGSIERDFGGTGLGLAICKQLIDLMGGEIGVLSEEGIGATFWFTLTLPLGPSARRVSSAAAPVAGRAGRLLLVEDNRINQNLARAVLEIGGHAVDVVADGASAIRAVAEGAYDLVLMDVQMPGMDGMTATRHIRALGGGAATIPILAMTANVLPDQVRMFREAGMDDHVGKPFDRAELYRVIEHWLAREADPGAGQHEAGPRASGRETVRRAAGRPGDDPSLLDRIAYDAVIGLIGGGRIAGTLETLAKELDASFAGACETREDRDQLRFEAHHCVSSAGTLGFFALSDAARALESCNEQRIAQEGPEAFHRGLAEVRNLADRTARYAERLAAELAGAEAAPRAPRS
ncbi:ATP-binding protein [Methylobacterium sp. J-078]|uniref:ATP-binding protein n=1 Tax=Methylobacterium sp. J-078 TaxID=2836657 RepID=UPI001FB9FED5|nr:ATP-binding protein [Methylobacterium sp. J-078]MCJ2046176.1 ATP-binding protein [Methylobacterium sp. J-078]